MVYLLYEMEHSELGMVYVSSIFIKKCEDLCLYSLNKLCEKQSLLRSLRKKVCRLEKSTPPPGVAIMTKMSYVNSLAHSLFMSNLCSRLFSVDPWELHWQCCGLPRLTSACCNRYTQNQKIQNAINNLYRYICLIRQRKFHNLLAYLLFPYLFSWWEVYWQSFWLPRLTSAMQTK